MKTRTNRQPTHNILDEMLFCCTKEKSADYLCKIIECTKQFISLPSMSTNKSNYEDTVSKRSFANFTTTTW